MKKKVVRIDEKRLPEPFKTYWFSNERLNRDYKFYLVDEELYIGDESNLLHHWTLDGCGGICCFMFDNNIRARQDMPYVLTDGTYLFEVIQTYDYETSIRNPDSGACYVVHSG